LAIVHRIACELGGDVRCESKVGVGTRFVVQLPLKHAEISDVPAEQPELPSTRARILVVDDEEAVLRTVERILGSQHELVTVQSGRAAKSLLATDQRFDLILCDVMMPDISGVDLHRWLAEHHPELGQRTAFITAGVFTPRSSDYLASVPNPCIEKPFHAQNLQQLVAELVSDRKRSERSG
jgi:CheY-like chemotaxis protein